MKAYPHKIQVHLDRLSIDDTTLMHATAAWTIIRDQLPGMIEEFYEHLYARGAGAYIENVDRSCLKARQFEYFRSLFAGEFDRAYQAHTDPIADKHRRAGVDLSLYIAAYGWFSERLFKLIATHTPPPPSTQHDVFLATNKLMYFDMILAAKGAEIVVLDV